MNNSAPDLSSRNLGMKSREKRIDRLKQVLVHLSFGEIVQNRQLKTLLGSEDYARYLDDCCEQEQLREMLVDSLRQKSLFVGFPFDQLYATVLDAYRNIIHVFIRRPRTA